MGAPSLDLRAATTDQARRNQPASPPNPGALSTGAAATKCSPSAAFVLAASGQLAGAADWLSGLRLRPFGAYLELLAEEIERPDPPVDRGIAECASCRCVY